MKNFARLAVNFSLCFAVIFLAATGFRFLSLHVSWIKVLPPKPETALTLVISAAWWSLTFTLFFTILLTLSYAIRRSYAAFMSVLAIMGLSLVFCFAVCALLKNWETVPPAQAAPVRLGSNGLMLSGSLNRNETTVILLNGNTDSLGPRVTSYTNQPLVFHETTGANFSFPPVPFGGETPWFMQSLAIDIRLNSETLQSKFNEGILPFLIFAGSLIFLLTSLGSIIKLSAWPLVNFFLGVLVFRGILALETFINSPDILEIIGSFLKGMIPVSLSIPALFLALGALMHLYSFLVFIIRRRTDDEY